MTQHSPVDVAAVRGTVERFSTQFNDGAFRIVSQVAVAAAKVRAIAARRSDNDQPVDLNHVRASVEAAERVSVGVHGIAAAAGELRRAADARQTRVC